MFRFLLSWLGFRSGTVSPPPASSHGAVSSGVLSLSATAPRISFPVLAFSASYVLLDAFLGLIITRLLYLGAKKSVERIFDLFQARLQARLARRAELPYSTFLSLSQNGFPSGRPIVPASEWNGGGVGGTNVSEHQARQRSSFFPFGDRYRAGEFSAARLQATDASETAASNANRRDWIAVTDPRRLIEVPVYPEICSLVKALSLELLESQSGRRAIRLINTMSVLFGGREAAKSIPSQGRGSAGSGSSTAAENGTVKLQRPLQRLPQELISYILVHAACPSLAPNEPRSSPTNILLLSKRYYNLIIPRLYHSVSLHTPASFRSFRCTLALHNPGLGKHVRRLQIGSAEFDSDGYCPAALADHHPLSVGIEQMILASPNLEEISLDLFSLSALHLGTVSKLESGPQPRKLCTELTTIPYLSLPTFEDLNELELLTFGLDVDMARELRTTLPLIRKLELRLVTRRRNGGGSSSARRSSDHRRGRIDSAFDLDLDLDQDSDQDEDEDHNQQQRQGFAADGTPFHLPSDLEDFVAAVDLLRRWPEGDTRQGAPLDHIIVYAWPSAVRKIKKRLAARTSPTDHSLTPVKVDLDRGYLLGPRRGAHVLWRKDKARAAWAT
ncbi:hypothetical protein BCV70DRAFT_197196 [Testicularia cyperi]|uniref:Uncharacterized protein n=1 Tax=Testicularia cyperi TaxID=1882483 RepID=A0A317XXW4_9BASI|nr:hypothetical protein BCV70DRAFT_197196 [Testicularia cyperi]